MRKILILVLLVMLGGFVFFYSVQQTKNTIAETVTQFFTAAINGDEAVFAALAPRLQGYKELAAALQAPRLWQFGEIKQIRLTSLHRATAEIVLFLVQKPVSLEAVLVRHQGNWQIIALPQLVEVPLAIVTESENEQVTIMKADGEEVELYTKLNLQPFAVGSGIVLDGNLVYFAAHEQLMLAKLLSLADNILESENSGLHKLAEKTIFLQEQAGKIKIVPANNAFPGMENLTAYVREGVIEAVLLPQEFKPQQLRVLLKTNNFAHLLHQEIYLTATADFTLEDKIAQEKYQFAPGQTLHFRPLQAAVAVTFPSGESKTFSNRLHLYTSGKGRFKVENLRRGSPAFVPQYRGKFEISLYNQGLLLLNEVPLEAYLYSVVPSEMPLNFGLEALKVQAIAARTYAVASVLRNSLQKYGAHVDDSVAFQVYNNVPEDALGIAAVEATRELIVKYDGAPADTRFFSTSAGVTAAAEEVWHDDETGNFPGKTVPYLSVRSQLQSGMLPDVETEKGAHEFFTSAAWLSYDSSSPWFRWQLTMKRAELEAVLTRSLPERWQAQPQFVLTKEEDKFVSKEIPSDPVGTLLDLNVVRRGRGGNLLEIEIVGTKGTYRVRKEYNIRFTLRPQSPDGKSAILIKRSDGSIVRNYSLLPSAFCVFEIKRADSGQIEAVQIAGGGNGHGVGMSQWGARGLAEKGATYRQILEHYYPGCTVEQF